MAKALDRAEFGVEESDPRALSQYERLGYVPYGHAPEPWEVDGPDGTTTRYGTL